MNKYQNPEEEFKPIAREQEIVIQKRKDETLVFDLRTNSAICLNKTSVSIWENCTGKNDIASIAKLVGKRVGSSVSQKFVRFGLSQLQSEGLLQNSPKRDQEFAGVSRREAIKGIGLSAAIAMPFVSSVVAPAPVSAQSCVVSNQNVGIPVASAMACDQFDSLCCSGDAISGFGCGPSCVTCRCA